MLAVVGSPDRLMLMSELAAFVNEHVIVWPPPL